MRLAKKRDALARTKAVIELFALRAKPKFLGPAIPITGDGRVTLDTVEPQ